MDTQQSPTGNPTEKSTETKAPTPLSDKAAETLAGDNTFLAAILKVLLSPLTLLVGGALVVYWMSVSKQEKTAHDKLKLEHEGLEEDYTALKKKYKKLKSLLEPGETKLLNQGEEPVPQKRENTSFKSYKTAYLD
jgi:flagellar motility protein MotE (MotC chaperone)